MDPAPPPLPLVEALPTRVEDHFRDIGTLTPFLLYILLREMLCPSRNISTTFGSSN